MHDDTVPVGGSQVTGVGTATVSLGCTSTSHDVEKPPPDASIVCDPTGTSSSTKQPLPSVVVL